MYQVRINKQSRIIFGRISINSIRNKFEKLTYIINNEIENKLYEKVPTSPFLMQGYSNPFRKNRTSEGGDILLYIREDISFKIIKTESAVTMKVF